MISFYESSASGRRPSPVFVRTMTFPGGEAHIVEEVLRTPHGKQIAYVQGGDGDTLMKLAMWADSCRQLGLETIAVIPYLPGARQDRGRPLGAKVYADFINSMRLDRVICFDPHSDVMPALLDRCTVVHLHDLVRWVTFPSVVGVIAPDVGARKRAEGVASVLKVPLYQATKHRDFSTGKLSGFACEPLPDKGTLLVVDDICDGGGTFVGLADAIDRGQLALWVSHGIFSKGTFDLRQRYSHIYTTDSHPGHPQVDVQITPLLNFLLTR